MRLLAELLVVCAVAFGLALLVFTLAGSSWPVVVAVFGFAAGAALLVASRDGAR